MNDILSWLTLIISAVSTLCTLVLSWILFKKEQNKTYLKERYELVIFPIFNLLEEHLYKKEITFEIKQAVEKCEDIIADNKLIAGGKLSYVFSLPLDKINFQSRGYPLRKKYSNNAIKIADNSEIAINGIEYLVIPNIKTFMFRVLYVYIFLSNGLKGNYF